MDRHSIIETIGKKYHISNIEKGEFSYIAEAGGKDKLVKLLGYKPEHVFLDIRFEDKDTNTVILIETKQEFVDEDSQQLSMYLDEERALHPTNKIIGILANTNNNEIKVRKSFIDNEHILKDETVLDSMEHYKKLFNINQQNDRETVMRNTYKLNEELHKKDIPESLRSQFVGTSLLYIKEKIKDSGITYLNDNFVNEMNNYRYKLSTEGLMGDIKSKLKSLLDGSENKETKIKLLETNVLEKQKIKELKIEEWVELLDIIMVDIYRYINTDSSEGQDILNMFFITFNKYTGKADKNQAFTPDHITEFMCRITDVDRTKVVFDGTCGSGSFLVQAMIKELSDCRRGHTEKETKELIEKVKKHNIFGIEYEDIAYGLSTTNMLIHGDGNSNILKADLFESADFIEKADPDVILMNPPYNAKPKTIPDIYKQDWTKEEKNGTTDPTKGLVFIKFISDIIEEINRKKERLGFRPKTVKCAVLLPVAVAIGGSNKFKKMKNELLKYNTLDAVFTLPNEVFYPGASASACCMLFTFGKPHDSNISTFFGYCKDDGFKKKKNLGRVEQFGIDGYSKWKKIEKERIELFRNKQSIDGKSSVSKVTGDDERLCEAYMKTDYSKLKEEDFQKTINDYLGYLVKNGNIYEN